MKSLLYVPIVLSLIALGAHFMRDGNQLGVAGSLVLIALLVVRRVWVARVVQAALILGAIEWLLTLYELIEWRAIQGVPASRAIVILGCVAAVTACSSLLFQSKTLKRIYGFDRREKTRQ